jgi:hypothetical protein
VKDENVDLLVDSQNILNKWKKYFSQLLNVRRVTEGARGIIAGSGTVLQAGRSRVRILTGSLKISID